MTDQLFVLDASALLCLLFDEPGAQRVEARLSHALVSTVNYHETFAKLIDHGVAPENARSMLSELDIEIVPVDCEQADCGGVLRPATREIDVSLGGRSCLALALAHDAVAVTTDPGWAALDIDINVEVVR